MSDYNSSLPIRTESDGDAVVKLADATTPSQQAEIDSGGRLKSRIEDSDGHELQVESDGTISSRLLDEAGQAYTENNPLPVSLEESEGDEIEDYQTSSSIAKDASVNHDYTVSGSKTLISEQVWISGSGKLKVEVQLETGAATGIFNTKYVAFNSTSNPNIEIPLKKLSKQVTGAIVRVKITNRDNQAQDLYSTLSGIEK